MEGLPASPSAFALHASSAPQAGKTSLTSARREPPSHSNASTPVASELSFFASPPPSSSCHTCDEPSRVERKPSVRPSGLKRGRVSEAGFDVSRRGSPPATGASHSSALRAPPARSISVRT